MVLKSIYFTYLITYKQQLNNIELINCLFNPWGSRITWNKISF